MSRMSLRFDANKLYLIDGRILNTMDRAIAVLFKHNDLDSQTLARELEWVMQTPIHELRSGGSSGSYEHP